jgi:glycine oxidase
VAAKRTKHTDAIVVGGGVIGLACAWRVAQRGLRVRVLERDAVGSGASGVAAGMLAPVGEATWGEEGLLALAMRSHALWPRFAGELSSAADRDVGYLDLGSVHAALDRDEAAELRRRYELMRSLELEASWLRGSECRRLEPGLTPACTAGIHAPHEAAADPRRVVEALGAAAAAEGVEVIEGATVSGALHDGERLAGVRTADGAEHRADAIVLATGAWGGEAEWLPAEARPTVRPVKGQILTLRGSARPPLCERIVVTERIYVVPRGDGRVVVGATVEERGFDTRITAGGVHELLREAYRALPEVAELELVETTAGLRPATPDNVPLIGHGAIDGLLLATGHYRNGVLLAPITAEAIAALLDGDEPDGAVAAADPARFGARAVVA